MKKIKNKSFNEVLREQIYIELKKTHPNMSEEEKEKEYQLMKKFKNNIPIAILNIITLIVCGIFLVYLYNV